MEQELIRMAIEAITEEIARHPEALLYKERGRLRRMLGQESEAIADLREAIRLDPTVVSDLREGRREGEIGPCH